ncbi:DUF4430 domain-containing protein [Fusibacter tunisiensis]|uniref:Transcobalamin-like C-terminal domain-containing protein n=1 Tax=Fusibacter tunisiensis TaxID=1008308 RepID=A0ABS2MSR8_9FIRM|nr:DUF4430 domain-containing protein [Fusibacter tunisiensis]MBM7562461.1 hypothetical protein [Fusibacter tunisiensis]
MNKKVMWIVIAVLCALVALFMYNQYLAPGGQEGSKTVTMEIVVAPEGIEKTYEFKTDADFVYALMMEVESTIKPEFQESSFGIYITGLEGYTADETKNEFYSIKVNGEDAVVGVKELPVEDGKTYRFELSTW